MTKLPQEKEIALQVVSEELSLYPQGMASAVLRFMIAFDQPVINNDSEIKQEDFMLAFKLMDEEITEMWKGFHAFSRSATLENKTEFVDGALDTIYVILWSLLKMGVPVDKLFSEIQRSNMAKLLPDGGYEKNEFGKVRKPATWTAPDLFSILADHAARDQYRNGLRYHGDESKQS